MEPIQTISDFESRLALYLKIELKYYANYFKRDIIKAFDLGCFPWNKTIEISFLTDFEPDLPEKYQDNPANWRLYNFTSNCAYGSWYAVREIAEWLGQYYNQDPHRAEEIFIACAKAATDPAVQEILKTNYQLADDFQVIVKNPDNPHSKNYCTILM